MRRTSARGVAVMGVGATPEKDGGCPEVLATPPPRVGMSVEPGGRVNWPLMRSGIVALESARCAR